MKFTEDMRKVCRSAVEHFGVESQKAKAVEELGELLVELGRESFGRSGKAKLATEIADVRIMLEQLEIMADCAEEVKACLVWKTRRLAGKIKKEENK